MSRQFAIITAVATVLPLLISASCPQGGGAAAAAFAASFTGAPPHQHEQKQMLFGGPGHETYLGCLSCSEYATDSVFNPYGPFGSDYSATSIHNAYGEFGSAYSVYSACNPYATDPPVIVDENGSFYGRLTLNLQHSQVTSNSNLIRWLADVACN